MLSAPVTYPALTSAQLSRPVVERAIEGEYIERRSPGYQSAQQQGYRSSASGEQHYRRRASGQTLTDALPERQRQLALYEKNGHSLPARESFLIDIYA